MTRYRVVLSRAAAVDIRAIRDHLRAHASPRVVRKTIEQLLAVVDSLEAHAQRGAPVDELFALGQWAARQVVARPYRVIYHVHADRVLIVMVCDGRRDVAALVQQRMLAWPE